MPQRDRPVAATPRIIAAAAVMPLVVTLTTRSSTTGATGPPPTSVARTPVSTMTGRWTMLASPHISAAALILAVPLTIDPNIYENQTTTRAAVVWVREMPRVDPTIANRPTSAVPTLGKSTIDRSTPARRSRPIVAPLLQLLRLLFPLATAAVAVRGTSQVIANAAVRVIRKAADAALSCREAVAVAEVRPSQRKIARACTLLLLPVAVPAAVSVAVRLTRRRAVRVNDDTAVAAAVPAAAPNGESAAAGVVVLKRSNLPLLLLLMLLLVLLRLRVPAALEKAAAAVAAAVAVVVAAAAAFRLPWGPAVYITYLNRRYRCRAVPQKYGRAAASRRLL